jgi:tetratricopeptide (TPR) repeat protein
MRVERLGSWLLLVVLLAGSGAYAADHSSEAELRQQLDRASAAFEQGRYEEARKAYQQATEKDPGNVRAWTGLGWSLWKLGQRDRAMKIWTDLLKVSPNEPKILIAIAQGNEENGNLNEALASYDRVIKQGAELKEAHLGRARVLERMGNPAAAEADLQDVLRRNPGEISAKFALARVYKATNRPADAERLLKELTAISPQPKYLRMLGDGMMELGRYDEAAAYYRRSLAMDPDQRGIVLGLARTYARAYRYAEAVDVLKPYLDRHPDDVQIREELAKDAGDSQNFAESERQWQMLTKQHPDELKYQVGLAMTYRLAGKFDDALRTAREVVGREPQNVDALGILADDAALSGREAEAIQWLERILAVQPNAQRANQLGRLRIARGDRFANAGDEEPAAVEYRAAARAFEISNRIETTTNADAALGLVTALRLGGDTDRAIALGEQFIRRAPNMEAMQHELYETYAQVGDYDNAEKYLKLLRKNDPGNVHLEQQQALIEFNRGDHELAIEQLEKVLHSPIRRRVPILLYHGISQYPRTPSAMPAANFRDQMVALRKEGYQTITVDQLSDYLDGKIELPPKAILITFDDARADTVRNAEPIFKELGFHGAIFIPAGEIGQHGPYYAPWRKLADLQSSGQWEMQCHAWKGHRRVPIDDKGHEGYFFTDRQWLPDKQRLETKDEFYKRLDDDYRTCPQVVMREVPGARVTGYAYPFGDLGQRRFNNEPSAIEVNIDIVKKYYRAAFVENPSGMALPNTPRYRLPRYELPPDSKGVDLMRVLRTADPENSTLFEIATLYAWSGRFTDAEALFDDLEKRGFDRATLLALEGQVRQWNGDFAGAREMLTTAGQLRPEDTSIQRKLADLDLHVAPLLQGNGSYYHDNRDRSNFGVGPQGKVWLTDRLALSAQYQYRDFKHNKFRLDQLPSEAAAGGTTGGTTTTTGTPPTGTTPTTTPAGTGAGTTGTTGAGTGTGTITAPSRNIFAQTAAEVPTTDLEARGNQIEGELEYALDYRTSFSVGGGFADFQDRSEQRILKGPKTEGLAAGRINLGLGDYADVSVGGSRGYVPAAGAILEDLTYGGGFGLARLRPIPTWTLELYGGAERYSDDNNRVSTHARLTKLFWADPDIELGYQFVFDNAKRENPFFYTPDQFIANEGVFSFRIGAEKPLTLTLAGAVGEGSERSGNPEAEGSAVGGIEINLVKRVRFTLAGGRTQSAKFKSNELNGALSVRF